MVQRLGCHGNGGCVSLICSISVCVYAAREQDGLDSLLSRANDTTSNSENYDECIIHSFHWTKNTARKNDEPHHHHHHHHQRDKV